MVQSQYCIDPYLAAFRGRFTSVLRWEQLAGFWGALRNQIDDQWYIYAVGETPPVEACSNTQMENFIDEIDILLRNEHDEDYCAIVYADDLHTPQFVKIFDPYNLGVSCGFSENPPLPGWVLSKVKPVNLSAALQSTNNRRRWWQKIFA
jgi:hypothetical protein